jgi:hypothetical protein
LASGGEYFCGDQMTGSLKFPKRSTARKETSSGFELLKPRPI